MPNTKHHKPVSPKYTPQAARERRRVEHSRRRITLGVVAIVVFLAGAYVLWPRPRAALVSGARLHDDPSFGPADARVTIIEYGDFG